MTITSFFIPEQNQHNFPFGCYIAITKIKTVMLDELKDKAADLLKDEKVKEVVEKVQEFANTEKGKEVIETVKEKATEFIQDKFSK